MTGYPQDPTKLEVGAAFGANLSTALSSLTYTALTPTYVKPYAVITRGRVANSGQCQPTQIDFGLKNPAGVFSPRNISGPHYGQLRQNTPIRVRLDPGTGYVTRGIALNPSWPVDWTGPDIDDKIQTSAMGITSQLGQAHSAVKSAPRRWLEQLFGTIPVAAWTLEDGPLVTEAVALYGSSTLRPFVGSHPSGAVVTYPQFGQGSLAPWLPSVLSRSSAAGLNIMWAAVAMPGFTNTWTVEYAYASGTDGPVSFVDINPIYLGGVDGWPQLSLDPGNGQLSVAFDTPEVILNISNLFDGLVHAIRWTCTQSGADVAWSVYVDGTLALSGTELTYTLLTITRFAMGSAASSAAVATGYVCIWTTPATPGEYAGAVFGNRGEHADDRFARLCNEDSISHNVDGSTTESMGEQPTADLVTLLRQCEATAEGVMLERRTGELGLDLLNSRYNETPALTLLYTKVVADLKPDDDDRDTVNYAEVSRDGGSSRIVEVTAGPLGTGLVSGVGKYDGSTNRSLDTDDQASNHAGWITSLGTVDEQRHYLVLNLRQNTSLITQWLACDIGSRIQVTSPPAIQTGPAMLDLVLEGYRETLDGVEWTVEMWLMPFVAYQVFEIASGPDNTSRIAADSFLAAGVSATATSLSVTSTSSAARWIDSATYPSKFPIIITIAGERMSCTAITGTGATQTFTVVRGLDGVSKALPINSDVQVYRPARIAL